MLSTMWRFIHTKYWGILCWALCEDLFTQNTEEHYVEHCRKIYLHKILRNTFMLSTMWRFIYTKYWGILCWALCEDLLTQNTEEYFVEHCGNIYLHKILIILYVKHCDKIYLHKLLRNTVCWAPWEDLFTQNTEEYFMLNCEKICLHKILRNTLLSTVGRFIYTKYW